jgi:hypothetical protein
VVSVPNVVVFCYWLNVESSGTRTLRKLGRRSNIVLGSELIDSGDRTGLEQDYP